MKARLLICVLLSLSAYAQTLPTVGLQIQYDMLTTGGGGTTLTDLSGNGNTGTLHGTTVNAQGRVFNGTSDWVTVPAVIGNSDFTVIAVAQPKSGGSYSSGATWAETDATENNMIRFNIQSSNWTVIVGNAGAVSANLTAFTSPYRSPEYDVFTFSRNTDSISFRMASRPNFAVTNQPASHITIATTTFAGLGTENLNGSQSNFWAGTLSYFVLYNRQLSLTELQSAYNAISASISSRPVFITPWPASVQSVPTNAVWQRQGLVNGQTVSGNHLGEPEVIYDSNCPTLSIANCFRMWTDNAGALYEFESPDGSAWTARGSPTPVISTNGGRAGIIKVSGIYHAYTEHTASPIVAFDHYTSLDGITWTVAQTSVLTIGSAGQWDATSIDNPHVYFDGTTWYMMYEATGTGYTGTVIGGATAPDGVNWTKVSANPIIGIPDSPTGSSPSTNQCQGPWFTKIAGTWWLWCGAPAGTRGIYRFASPVFNSKWVWTQQHASIQLSGVGNDTAGGDPSLVEVNGKTYLFMETQQISGAYAGIKAFVANIPLAQLIQTSEGVISDWP